MSSPRLKDYDKSKPTVMIDLDQTLVDYYSMTEQLQARKSGLPFPTGGIAIEKHFYWLRPSAVAFLDELRSLDLQLFILTRGMHHYQERVVEAFGLSHYFVQVLGRKHYDPRRLKYSTNHMARPNHFVLVDDAALGGDPDNRSINKLIGLGLSLPKQYDSWTDAHKQLAEDHFVLCSSYDVRTDEDITEDSQLLTLLIPEIRSKLKLQP